MVVPRSSAAAAAAAAGTEIGTGLEERTGKENGMESRVDDGTSLALGARDDMSFQGAGSVDMGMGMGGALADAALADTDTATPTAAERKLLEKAELVAAEFDFPTERLDACVAEFVREMGVFIATALPFFSSLLSFFVIRFKGWESDSLL